MWPANGDVGREAAEVDCDAGALTWRNGFARSFGNFAIRQMGVPTVTVPIGAMNDTGMPFGLTFGSKAYGDAALMGYAFEQAHPEGRFAPPRSPGLESDIISSKCTRKETQRTTEAGGPCPWLERQGGEIVRTED